MKVLGTIVNGHVQFDRPSDLPDGTRVFGVLLDEFEEGGGFEYPHPMAPYNLGKELELLRASIEDADRGHTRPFAEVVAEMTLKHQLPPVSGS